MGTPNQPWQPGQRGGTPPGGQPGWHQQPAAQPGYPGRPGYGAPPGYPPQQAFGQQPPGYGPGFPPPAPKKRGPWLWLVPVLVVVVAAAVVVPILLTRDGGTANAQARPVARPPTASSRGRSPPSK